MTIKELIKQPEGRRLEFKDALPERSDHFAPPSVARLVFVR